MPGAAAISSSGEYDDTQIEGMRLRPGLAMSQDAKNWARIEGDHHTGVYTDQPSVSSHTHSVRTGHASRGTTTPVRSHTHIHMRARTHMQCSSLTQAPV